VRRGLELRSVRRKGWIYLMAGDVTPGARDARRLHSLGQFDC
jgi:hypothetical protein